MQDSPIYPSLIATRLQGFSEKLSLRFGRLNRPVVRESVDFIQVMLIGPLSLSAREATPFRREFEFTVGLIVLTIASTALLQIK